MDFWKEDMNKANRSMLIRVINKTKYNFKLEKHKTKFGIFSKIPDDVLRSGTNTEFGAESAKALQGSEGSFSYRPIDIASLGPLKFKWNGPFVGTNSQSHSLIEPFDIHFSVNQAKHGILLFVITEAVPWKEKLVNACRSAQLIIHNNTEKTLKRGITDLKHGMFRALPPEIIYPSQIISFGSEASDGSVMTGSEGIVEYLLDDDSENFKFSWNNPFVGKNSESHEHTDSYQIESIVGTGNNCSIIWTLEKV